MAGHRRRIGPRAEHGVEQVARIVRRQARPFAMAVARHLPTAPPLRLHAAPARSTTPAMLNESPPEVAPPAECPTCHKPSPLCVCAEVTPLANRIALLILQHPQEQDKTLGTARLLAHHLTNATLTVGLSWPSLAKALGRPADPRQWAVLYLGSAKAEPDREVVVLNDKGAPCPDQDAQLAGIRGVVVLDGTWSQAKALWWRNPWVLKCRRVILGPKHPSRYGRVRTEPRKDSLSTIEAAGQLLSRLERRPEIETALDASFQLMLERFRQARKDGVAGAAPTSAHSPRRDWRKRKPKV
jgi:hypothetical protein